MRNDDKDPETKAGYSSTRLRFSIFCDIIRDANPGTSISYSEIVEKIQEKADADLKRWDRTIRALSKLYNEEYPEESFYLEASHGSVTLTEKPSTLFEERKAKARRQKRLISMRLLYWLFDQETIFYLPEKDDEHSRKEGADKPNYKIDRDWGYVSNWKEDCVISENLLRKRRILRSRTVASVLIDAGTTNFHFCEVMLGAERFPLNVKGSRGDGSGSVRKLRPHILTNSIPIAGRVADSEQSSSLELTVIGGIENKKRRSLVGEMAIMWARHLRTLSKIDLSVIGTTGIRLSDDGILSAYMDDTFECQLKSEFLGMANFRIVICDSSKIVMGSCLSIFSSLTAETVDLIVTDDGSYLTDSEDEACEFENYVVEKMRSFLDHATDQGVGVMVIGKKESISDIASKLVI